MLLNYVLFRQINVSGWLRIPFALERKQTLKGPAFSEIRHVCVFPQYRAASREAQQMEKAENICKNLRVLVVFDVAKATCTTQSAQQNDICQKIVIFVLVFLHFSHQYVTPSILSGSLSLLFTQCAQKCPIL